VLPRTGQDGTERCPHSQFIYLLSSRMYLFAAYFCCQLLLTLFLARRLFVTLMMEEIRSSETSVLTTATRRHISEDGFFQHSSFKEECRLLECDVLWLLLEPKFLRSVFSP
jgi:hypothetical protein